MAMTDHDQQRILAFGVNLTLAALAAEVTEALRAAGLRSILIKGPVLVRWLYGNEAARASCDVDLLVDPATADTAEAVLHRLGFERAATGIGAAERPRHASTWTRASVSAPVDLHTTVVGVGVSPPETWSVLRERTATEPVAGASVEVARADARLLLLALHAAQHGEREPQPLRDLARALEIATRAEWADASTLAQRLHAEPAFAAGLCLLEPGRILREELQLPTARTVESALRARTAPELTLGLEWLVRLPGIGPRLRFTMRKVFPPAAFMRTWSPLARRSGLGLAAAYLWRPLWLLLRSRRAIRAWRRARKESRP
jgi:hypothetical protein